ncbi:glycosyltransferase family 4 protein [Pseudoalteromonas sp. SCSIO 43201]|uniref:glycosyltransferase family 4 protein n=1 Tax=Pseudoalteromonas sp. SCSIO 43201 TaxID=2822842 RepID=UPI002074BAC7|nr:glycosyltransferase family 4 protein [Pseudoalteromonas sp. SCSIO 43201]USD29093.1 glycosyltransferase family 4 protein [Pseudoalteromonas sp. SCSIO 43201]
MEIVHVCNNFVGTKVHLNQVKSIQLENPSVKQSVIIPVYDSSHVEINNELIPGVSLYYEVFNVRFLKYFPLVKLLYISIYLVVKYSSTFRRASIVYSHTIWTNGFLGYLSKMLFNADYIVAARSNDYHTFLRKLPHYRFIVRRIVKNSRAVVFISDVYQSNFLNRYPYVFKNVENTVIYNGIDQFWVNKSKLPIEFNKSLKTNDVLFVGRFNKTKNISKAIRAVELVRAKNREVRLRIVGGDKEELLSLLGIDALPSWVIVEGKIDKEKLHELYLRSICLLVPSVQETFGLVYIEALSSGCSVIHSKGEAIDGIFKGEENIISVDPYKVSDISSAVATCYGTSFSFNREVIEKVFSWSSFAKKTINLINQITK